VGSVLALIAAMLAGVAPPGFSAIGAGPAGGTVWQGVVPGRYAPPDRLPTLVYLPPNAAPTGRYRLVVLLHGFPGSPYSFTDGLQLGPVADALIASGRVPPFVAVMPRAGPVRYDGEWAGRWERFVVREVLPWAGAHLPVTRDHRAWTIAGLSSGGYGAVDIGLRHPRLFGTLESWSGYYRPYRDGPLRDADRAELAAHDPTLLVDREAPLLRRLDTRFFVSCGSTHDRRNEAFARAFSARLRALRLRHLLLLTPGAHDGAFWRSQLPEALLYALRGR
jgi:enterochelin esterase-like enzyme